VISGRAKSPEIRTFSPHRIRFALCFPALIIIRSNLQVAKPPPVLLGKVAGRWLAVGVAKHRLAGVCEYTNT
jgi:hypothetical protein